MNTLALYSMVLNAILLLIIYLMSNSLQRMHGKMRSLLGRVLDLERELRDTRDFESGDGASVWLALIFIGLLLWLVYLLGYWP